VIAGGSGSGMSIAGIAVASFVSPYDVPSGAVSQRPRRRCLSGKGAGGRPQGCGRRAAVGRVLRACLRSGAGAWCGGLDGTAGAAGGGRADLCEFDGDARLGAPRRTCSCHEFARSRGGWPASTSTCRRRYHPRWKRHPSAGPRRPDCRSRNARCSTRSSRVPRKGAGPTSR